jgi:hypothetical protein
VYIVNSSSGKDRWVDFEIFFFIFFPINKTKEKRNERIISIKEEKIISVVENYLFFFRNTFALDILLLWFVCVALSLVQFVADIDDLIGDLLQTRQFRRIAVVLTAGSFRERLEDQFERSLDHFRVKEFFDLSNHIQIDGHLYYERREY